MKRLLEAAEIQAQVAEMGRRITNDYRGKPLTLVGVLTGGVVLVSDLMRCIELPLRIGTVSASSYRSGAVADELRLDADLLPDIRDRHVIVVDDILDTGRTMLAVLSLLARSGALSVRGAVLLWKKGRGEVDWTPDYYGFEIPNVFVVGYGLDYRDEHRCLPYVAALEEGDY